MVNGVKENILSLQKDCRKRKMVIKINVSPLPDCNVLKSISTYPDTIHEERAVSLA